MLLPDLAARPAATLGFLSAVASPPQRPWLEAGCGRLTWYRRRKQVREREALTLVATAREAVFDRLDWQLARLRRELETAARFADEGAVIITELAGYSGSSGR